jgi:hypothetical protein
MKTDFISSMLWTLSTMCCKPLDEIKLLFVAVSPNSNNDCVPALRPPLPIKLKREIGSDITGEEPAGLPTVCLSMLGERSLELPPSGRLIPMAGLRSPPGE